MCSVRGPTYSDVYRRQILTSNVSHPIERIKILPHGPESDVKSHFDSGCLDRPRPICFRATCQFVSVSQLYMLHVGRSGYISGYIEDKRAEPGNICTFSHFN